MCGLHMNLHCFYHKVRCHNGVAIQRRTRLIWHPFSMNNGIGGRLFKSIQWTHVPMFHAGWTTPKSFTHYFQFIELYAKCIDRIYILTTVKSTMQTQIGTIIIVIVVIIIILDVYSKFERTHSTIIAIDSIRNINTAFGDNLKIFTQLSLTIILNQFGLRNS